MGTQTTTTTTTTTTKAQQLAQALASAKAQLATMGSAGGAIAPAVAQWVAKQPLGATFTASTVAHALYGHKAVNRQAVRKALNKLGAAGALSVVVASGQGQQGHYMAHGNNA